MKDDGKLYSQDKLNELFERLKEPKTDTITQHELWDVYNLDEIKNYNDHLKSELNDREDGKLRESIITEESTMTSEQFCETHPTATGCVIAPYVDKNSHETVSRALRRYKEIQNESNALNNYYQRRYIREKMESIFHVRGYDYFERLIFILIIAVLAMLFIEITSGIERNGNLLKTIKLGGLEFSIWYFIIFDLIACTIFLSEYFLRLYFSDDRKWYWRNHKIDFVSSIPLTALFAFGLPMGTDLQWLRILRLLRIFRAMRIATFLWRGMERFEQISNFRLMKKSFTILVVISLFGMLLFNYVEGVAVDTYEAHAQTGKDPVVNMETVRHVESSENRNNSGNTEYVTQMDKSFWWTLTTLTTGGFGDLYRPRTFPGWLLTLFLVVSGIVVVGVFTATLTTIFRGEDSDELKRRHEELEVMVRDIQTKLGNLEIGLVKKQDR